jgi:hypothetical protein
MSAVGFGAESALSRKGWQHFSNAAPLPQGQGGDKVTPEWVRTALDALLNAISRYVT